MSKFVTTVLMAATVAAAGFLFFASRKDLEINPISSGARVGKLAAEIGINNPEPPPQPLKNPPETVKAIYATNWSAGTPSKLDYLINIIDNTELNALVVDIKDYSGYVGYKTGVEDVKKYDAEEVRIEDVNSLVRRLHDKGIYAIARLAVFQDPRLALARPDLAVKDSRTGEVWKDHKGLYWMDPASKIVWDYNLSIIRDVLTHGFDEINLDYIRFPSDGNLEVVTYPFWNGTTPKHEIIAAFFHYLRRELPNTKLSADIFGQATIDYGDNGIGQVIEDAYESFDYVAPMVYPSHYIPNFLGLGNPATHPYEVVKYSMDSALARLINYNQKLMTTSTSSVAGHRLSVKLRPWLQAFDLGADYTPEMVRKQISAVYDAAKSSPELLDGFMLWDASNMYDRRALLPER
ncbi:MAG TPA: putative glycoside hydrolase [Candidatus Paceibacterota bacterium]|nr:putative glycoside hydrolase [Candidatus Paceibacterota bacterium]